MTFVEWILSLIWVTGYSPAYIYIICKWVTVQTAEEIWL